MPQERWYTVPEIVAMLKVHEQTVRRWIKTGELRATLLGRRAGYRIRESDLEAFLEARTEGKDPALNRPGQGGQPEAAVTASGSTAV